MTEKTLENFVYGCDDKLEDGMAGKYIIYVDGNEVRLRVCPTTDWREYTYLRGDGTFEEWILRIGENTLAERPRLRGTWRGDARIQGIETILRSCKGDADYHAYARRKEGCARVENYQVIGGSRYLITGGEFFGAYWDFAASEAFGEIPACRELTARCIEATGMRDGWKTYENRSIDDAVKKVQAEQRNRTT